ncbi:MAG: hypothetical protein E7478_08305 [Ruminococcaceae bacterium]|nr:hypothetical protein [Oscillospiraceae bacterium]
MTEKLKRFYSTFGDRGVMFLLFAFSVVIHALLSINMELPAVNPDEIGIASIAAFYSGRDWSQLMSTIGYYYGYVQAVFYVPLMLVFGSPYALYKAMLVMNGVLISFIPMIAYHLASKLGILKVWQKSIIALSCGFYITYVAHSKFIWNEAISSLLPWALIWCVFMAWDRKNKYSKFAFSMLAGFTCAVCYGAHSRLIAVVIALVLTLLIARFVFRENILNLPTFFVTGAVSFVTEHFCRKLIQNVVWDGKARGNTMDNAVDRIGGLFEAGGFDRFIATLFGHLYTFFTSTMGLGAIAVACFVVLCFCRISEWKKNRQQVHQDGTRVYEPVKHKYSLRVTVFGIYGFFAVGGSLLLSVLYKFNSGQFGDIKDLIIFGRYTDNVAPLAVCLALIFLFRYGYTIYMIAGSAAIYGYICLGFVLTSVPLLKTGGYRESPILGLLPWRIGEDITTSFTDLSYVIMSSMVFTVFAAFVVCLCCTRRFKTQLISGITCAIFTYTTLFAAFEYLPMRAEENAEKIAPSQAICEYLYNDSLSPDIISFNTGSRTAALVQFLNPKATVRYIKKTENLPSTGIIIIKNGEHIPFTPDVYDVIGVTEEHTILAYGDAARDYMKYKNTSN